MRRLVLPFIVASGLLMIGASGASADEPAATASVPATPGKKICKIADEKLDELSGIVATRAGFIVINDSTDIVSHKKVFFLDTKCKIVNEVAYSGKGPLDTEDLILSPDGKTLWIADTGDNAYNKNDGTRRERIALWSMPVNGSKKPQLHRLTYPQGDYHDSEALLLNGDGTPLIVTKEIGKAAGIYQPSGPLQVANEAGVPLRRVGQVTVSATTTAGNPYARIGNKTIDGGAVAPDGSKVVLRTYTDALEWDVTNGDVVGALQKKPRTTGLPNETLGEAITYSADGKSFYTVSDMGGDTGATNYILQYTPATTVAVLKKAAAGAGGEGKKWYADLNPNDFTYLVGGVGLVGLILVGIGLLGIVRHRKRVRGPAGAGVADFDAPPTGDPETELIGVGGAPQRAGGYGGAGSGPVAGAGSPPGFYGGAPGGGRGPVYGSHGAGAGLAGKQPPRGAQPPARGAQPPARKGVYGGGAPDLAPRGPEVPPVRTPQPAGGSRGQGGGGGQGPRTGGPGQRPQGGGGQGQRQPGAYGPPAGRPQGGDPHADYRRPESRFDNPGSARR